MTVTVKAWFAQEKKMWSQVTNTAGKQMKLGLINRHSSSGWWRKKPYFIELMRN